MACRIILSAPVPFLFLRTLDLGLGFGTWIWDLNLGLDLGLTITMLFVVHPFQIKQDEKIYANLCSGDHGLLTDAGVVCDVAHAVQVEAWVKPLPPGEVPGGGGGPGHPLSGATVQVVQIHAHL